MVQVVLEMESPVGNVGLELQLVGEPVSVGASGVIEIFRVKIL